MGVRSIEDADLIKRLVAEGIVLEVCPHSQRRAGGFMRTLPPIRCLILWKPGVLTTISSDDPPFFATSIGKEYDALQALHGWQDSQMKDFTRRSLKAAFVDQETRKALLARLDAS